MLKLFRRRGLLEMRHVAIDGTRLKANASKHTAMSYGRMKEADARIAREIQEWFEEAERVDLEEDQLFGDEQGDELPPELRNAERRRQAIKEAMAELEREAEAAGQAEPTAKAQRNFADWRGLGPGRPVANASLAARVWVAAAPWGTVR